MYVLLFIQEFTRLCCKYNTDTAACSVSYITFVVFADFGRIVKLYDKFHYM